MRRICAGSPFVLRVLSQDPPTSTKFAALRRTLTQLRHRITKGRRVKPPEWILEKLGGSSGGLNVAGGANPNAFGTAAGSLSPHDNERTSLRSQLCSRLSVDPTLPSHYRVIISVPHAGLELFPLLAKPYLYIRICVCVFFGFQTNSVAIARHAGGRLQSDIRYRPGGVLGDQQQGAHTVVHIGLRVRPGVRDRHAGARARR